MVCVPVRSIIPLLKLGDYRISSVIRRSFYPSKTIPKNLDSSYKTDLDLWDCVGRVKLVL